MKTTIYLSSCTDLRPRVVLGRGPPGGGLKPVEPLGCSYSLPAVKPGQDRRRGEEEGRRREKGEGDG